MRIKARPASGAALTKLPHGTASPPLPPPTSDPSPSLIRPAAVPGKVHQPDHVPRPRQRHRQGGGLLQGQDCAPRGRRLVLQVPRPGVEWAGRLPIVDWPSCCSRACVGVMNQPSRAAALAHAAGHRQQPACSLQLPHHLIRAAVTHPIPLCSCMRRRRLRPPLTPTAPPCLPP